MFAEIFDDPNLVAVGLAIALVILAQIAWAFVNRTPP